MKHHRTFKNVMLECITIVAIIAMFASFFVIDLWPNKGLAMMLGSFLWLVLFAFANGMFEGEGPLFS